jgi:hypothetical protein
MYSAFVTHHASEQSAGTFTQERERFLEGTDEKLKVVLRGLSNEARSCLCSWPCLLMDEGRTQEIARLVEVVDISASATHITATIRALPGAPEITNNALFNIRTELDLGQYEFSRNHWAVKDRDIFAVLQDAGIVTNPALRQRFVPKPVPVLLRAELLAARDAISVLGHPDIDDLLLEAGVNGLEAGKELGGRRNRANAILKYAVDHPEAVTAENSLFWNFLLRYAPTAPPPASDPQVATTAAANPTPAPRPTPRSPNRVFVVHGRNAKARDDVVSFLASVGLVGIVLHEQPNMGRHLLTKFIAEAKEVTFAVVIMSDDDVGGANGEKPAPRARQNVILELGYFLAYLGQARVCALKTPKVETPSDFDGIVYIEMAKDDKWKGLLLRELRAANMPVT